MCIDLYIELICISRICVYSLLNIIQQWFSSYTPFTQVWRSLNNRWAMKNWPDLSRIFQRAPSDRQDLSMICQLSPLSLKQSFNERSINTQQTLNDRSTNTQWMLNEHSGSAQRSHWSLIDHSVIFQWMPNFSTPKERWLRDQRAYKDLPQKCWFLLILRDCRQIGPILYRSGGTQQSRSCVKGPLMSLRCNTYICSPPESGLVFTTCGYFRNNGGHYRCYQHLVWHGYCLHD